MSNETPGSPPPSPVVPLTAVERRVLGVLVEKAKTTPDAYPLSLNATVTGCNQKSNREPVMDLSDFEVEDTFTALQKKGLLVRVIGGRVERYRHTLYESWKVNKVELAVLGELLLRGPQTEGELRTRASRMEPIDDLDLLRSVLRQLADRKLVVHLSPPERRGALITHGFHFPQELDKLRSRHAADLDEPSAPPPAARPAENPAVVQAFETQVQGFRDEITQLRSVVEKQSGEAAEMKTQLAALTEQVRALKEALGVP